MSTEAAEQVPTSPAGPDRPASFREVFAVREFRPLFGTFLLSTAGDELARVALTVLVYQRTASPLLAALTFAIGHRPWLLGGPLLSTFADRLPRHRVLIATDVARALLLVLMALPGMPLAALLGLLFLVSGISAAAAAMTLLGWRRTHPASMDWLGRLDFFSLVLELAVLVVLAISLGEVAEEVWGNEWGVLLVVGVVLAGILVPLALHWRPRLLGRLSVPSAAALVLLGGFLLRTVVVMASEAV